MAAFPRDFGKYRLTGLLGAGGAAEVYRAETKTTPPRKVAIKRIHRDNDPETDTALLDEARIWRRLQHPNVVQVLEFGEHEDDWFLALELVEGVTLAALLKSVDEMPVPEALLVAERIARGLAHAHARTDEQGRPLGIVHRDVKPANILVSTSGEVKLTDFGIARATDRLSVTRIGEVKGSVFFLSPEQARGDATDGRSDLFSLGTVLHLMLTGRALVDLPEDELFEAISQGRIPAPPANFAGPVRELLAVLTAPARDARPADADEVVQRIGEILPPHVLSDAERLLASRVRSVIAGGGSSLGNLVRGDDTGPQPAALGGEVTRVVRGAALQDEHATEVSSAASAASVRDEEPVRESSMEIDRSFGRDEASVTVPGPAAAESMQTTKVRRPKPNAGAVSVEVENTMGGPAIRTRVAARSILDDAVTRDSGDSDDERTVVSLPQATAPRSAPFAVPSVASATPTAPVRIPPSNEIPELFPRSNVGRPAWLSQAIYIVIGVGIGIGAMLLAEWLL